MGVTGKFEVEVDVKASGDLFHELFHSKPHKISDIVPHHVQSCDLHEGDFGSLNSILQWEYTIGGEKFISKNLVEAVDEEKKMVRFKLLEGSSELKNFKSMTLTLHVVPKGEFNALKCDVEFEKFDDLGPYPTHLIDFIISMTRDVEAHHLKPIMSMLI